MIDSRLEDLLRNKRVAVVGPAAYLEGSNSSKIIDDYDIIIRPNQFNIPEQLKKDYGSRTDIMFHNMGTKWIPGLKEQFDQNKSDFFSLKMIVCPAIKAKHSDHSFMSWSDDHISECATNLYKITDKVPFYWVGVANYKLMFKEVGCEPYTGVMSILTVCNYPIDQLYITGFDFYSGNKIYHSGYLASVDSFQEQSNKNAGGGHGGGCTNKNLLCVKNRYLTDDRIVVDSVIKAILS